MKHFSWMVMGLLLVLAGGYLAHAIQTSGGIKVSDVRFDIGDGQKQAALLYRPPGATVENPAPAILATHGYINSRETQSGFAIEYARRGFVVLAIDQTGHGFSDGAAFSKGFGGPTGLTYLRALPFVDPDRVGLEGHSMGGWASLAAASAMPDDYAAIALVGSSTGAPFAAPGTAEWPRNLAVIFSQYDEFAPLMWEVGDAREVGDSAKLQGVFGVDGSVEKGQLYGSLDAGTARWLATPAVTHPGDHISHAAIGAAVVWMDRAIGAPVALPVSDQIWVWKEIGTLVALIGAMALLIGLLSVMLGRNSVAAAGLSNGAEPMVKRAGPAAIVLAAAIPAVTFYPLTYLGNLVANVGMFPQIVTNQIMVWALGNAVIALAASFRIPWRGGFIRGAVLALVSVGAVYLVVALTGIVFHTDMRFWVIALKPLADHHWPILLAYLAPFTLFFFLSQRLLLIRLLGGDPAAARYRPAIAITVGGLFVLLTFAYIWLLATGALPPLFDPLFTIVGLQFVPVLAMTAIIAVFCYRRTHDVWPGALVSALLVTWYIVGGQATHVW